MTIESLISSRESWESVSTLGLVLVIVGVAGEGIGLILEWMKWHLKEKWLFKVEFFFWAMVVVGLVIEMKGEGKVSERNGEIQGLLQAKNAELERSIAPRTFDDQLTAIQNLSRFTNQSVSIEFIADHEARRTAALIRFVLRNSGWNLTHEPSETPLPIFMVEGVRIEFRNSSKAAEALEGELNANNIESFRMMVGLQGPPRIVVRVGFKPSLARTKEMAENRAFELQNLAIFTDPAITNKAEAVKHLRDAFLAKRGTNVIRNSSFMGNGAGDISPSLLNTGTRGNNLLWE